MRYIQAAMLGKVLLFLLFTALGGQSAQAQSDSPPSAALPTQGEASGVRAKEQTIYVPVYSHIYFSNAKRRYPLAVTLSIRNTDVHRPITITSVRYYDTAGAMLQEYIKQPLHLGPMASTDVFIEERDSRGGSGANFLVEWRTTEAVNVPLVEAIMVGTAGTQGIAFQSLGRVIDPRP